MRSRRRSACAVGMAARFYRRPARSLELSGNLRVLANPALRYVLDVDTPGDPITAILPRSVDGDHIKAKRTLYDQKSLKPVNELDPNSLILLQSTFVA